jgi:hypothetical protein
VTTRNRLSSVEVKIDLARGLLTESHLVHDQPVAAFDLADVATAIGHLPEFATPNIGDIRGQMALSDRLIAERATLTVNMPAIARPGISSPYKKQDFSQRLVVIHRTADLFIIDRRSPNPM